MSINYIPKNRKIPKDGRKKIEVRLFFTFFNLCSKLSSLALFLFISFHLFLSFFGPLAPLYVYRNCRKKVIFYFLNEKSMLKLENKIFCFFFYFFFFLSPFILLLFQRKILKLWKEDLRKISTTKWPKQKLSSLIDNLKRTVFFWPNNLKRYLKFEESYILIINMYNNFQFSPSNIIIVE